MRILRLKREPRPTRHCGHLRKVAQNTRRVGDVHRAHAEPVHAVGEQASHLDCVLAPFVHNLPRVVGLSVSPHRRAAGLRIERVDELALQYVLVRATLSRVPGERSPINQTLRAGAARRARRGVDEIRTT